MRMCHTIVCVFFSEPAEEVTFGESSSEASNLTAKAIHGKLQKLELVYWAELNHSGVTTTAVVTTTKAETVYYTCSECSFLVSVISRNWPGMPVVACMYVYTVFICTVENITIKIPEKISALVCTRPTLCVFPPRIFTSLFCGPCLSFCGRNFVSSPFALYLTWVTTLFDKYHRWHQLAV